MIDLKILAQIQGLLTTSGDGGVAELPVDEQFRLAFKNGTGVYKANGLYIDDFSIAASGSLSIDLSGTLVDRLGNPLVFTAIKGLMVIADAANVNGIIVGNGATPWVGPFSVGTVSLTVPPGGHFHVTNPSAAGWAVTNATADILKLANSGAGSAVNGTIVLIGNA